MDFHPQQYKTAISNLKCNLKCKSVIISRHTLGNISICENSPRLLISGIHHGDTELVINTPPRVDSNATICAVYVHVTVCHNKFPCNKTNLMH